MGYSTRKTYPELKTKDIFDKELVPLFIVSRFLGLFSYNKERKVVRVRPVLAFFAHLLHTGVVIWALISSGKMMLKMNITFGTVQIVTYALSHGMNVALVLNHIVILFIKRDTFQEVVDMLLYIDTLWDKHATFYPKLASKSGIAALILFYYIVPVILQVRHSMAFAFITTLCFTEICFFLIVMQFVAILDTIRVHLKELREQLRNDEVHLINSIGKHQTLLRFCPVVNEAYSWQVLLMCLKFFVFNLMLAYTVILDNQNILPNVIRVLILLWEFSLVFPIARSCSEIEEEADNFNNKLFNLMRESKDLCSNDKLHLYVTMKQSVSFTACGFFNLGYPLVTSIIAAATTYLVILVQFSMT